MFDRENNNHLVVCMDSYLGGDDINTVNSKQDM